MARTADLTYNQRAILTSLKRYGDLRDAPKGRGTTSLAAHALANRGYLVKGEAGYQLTEEGDYLAGLLVSGQPLPSEDAPITRPITRPISKARLSYDQGRMLKSLRDHGDLSDCPLGAGRWITLRSLVERGLVASEVFPFTLTPAGEEIARAL